MTSFAIVRGVVIGLVVFSSAYVAWRKLLPKSSMRVLARVSARLNHEGPPGFVRGMGRRLQPAPATGSCGDGRGSCTRAGPAPTADAPPPPFKPSKSQ